MKMKGHFRVPGGECHSPLAHMALGYPYFPEIRGTDGRTSPNYKRGLLLVNLSNIAIMVKANALKVACV